MTLMADDDRDSDSGSHSDCDSDSAQQQVCMQHVSSDAPGNSSAAFAATLALQCLYCPE